MGSFQDFVILFSFLVEVVVLFFLERKAWHTIYTPLNFLMIPYIFVLLITVSVSGNFGFVDFYYPSILIWSVGLLLFAIPSLAIACYAGKKTDLAVPSFKPFGDDEMPRIFVYIGLLLVLMYSYRLWHTMGSSKFIIGSDEFAEEFAGYGFWGHMKKMCNIMLMLFIYYLNRERRWIWFFIIALTGVNLINMVKGAMIIPCVAGVMMRLASGKMKITGRFIIILMASAVAVFYITYLLAIVVTNEMTVTNEILQLVFRHFVHYFTSGTLGLSIDMQMGFPDSGTVDIILSPFINLLNHFSGNEELLSPVNPVYHFSGINLTNVRTVFGTLFIYTTNMQFAVYVLCLSTLYYLLKVFASVFDNVYTNVVYYYFCALLAMGWFEFYFFHLEIMEIPIMAALLHLLVWMLVGREFRVKRECRI